MEFESLRQKVVVVFFFPMLLPKLLRLSMQQELPSGTYLVWAGLFIGKSFPFFLDGEKLDSNVTCDCKKDAANINVLDMCEFYNQNGYVEEDNLYTMQFNSCHLLFLL